MKRHVKSFVPLFAAFALLLGGCQTWQGIQQDFGAMTTAIGEKTADVKAAMAENTAAPTCPPVNVDPQLDSASEFIDMENPSEENAVSHINLVRTASECQPDGDFVVMRIDLAFEGRLGPKARRKQGDRPFFAYPYFVVVTDNQGNELARELFAASITYEEDQDAVQLVETIRQRLPLADNGRLPPYQIHIGFQLTEEQLFYNASL
jgi:hypothetical protein